jgi:DNA polymerase II large subunit
LRLEEEARGVLEVARAARKKGLDPEFDVEIPLAQDLAARVEEQVQIPGVAVRVRELSKIHASRELVALHCAKEVASGKLKAWPSRELALDKSVRTGLSILTEGVLVAPLEGIAGVKIGKNADGSEYVDLFFAGPIRAAGGTAQAMSVLIADFVRRDLGIGRFQPTQAEIERYKEEVPAYKRAQHLQYAPGGEEVEHIVRNCPVCINGEGTEQEEVTGHRNLPRVETNQLRGGAVLVLAEGLALKAPKIAKIVSALKLPDWEFLERFIKKSAEPAKELKDGEIQEIESSDKFIKELIAGRPVFGHPSRIGGFRLRYGRSRTAGLASTSISPVTMHAVEDFLATGTQMKIERPGKGTICTPCSGVEGPIVQLKNGDLVQPQTIEAWKEVQSSMTRITDLGEILIPFGEFSENNAVLSQSSFTVEWWNAELAAVDAKLAHEWADRVPSFAEAVQISRQTKVPLHPAHNLFWHDLDWQAFVALSEAVSEARIEEGQVILPKGGIAKESLVGLGMLHRDEIVSYRLTERAEAFLAGLGYDVVGAAVRSVANRSAVLAAPPEHRFPVVQAAALLTGVPIKPRAPTRIGARMGRPEKADKRAMDPPVHVLFPVGHEGGSQRSIEDASEKKITRVKVGIRRCGACGRETSMVRCRCGGRSEPTGSPPAERELPLKEEYAIAMSRLKGLKPPKILKGVQGLVSKSKIPEPLEKGFLRALHELWVFKDGTIRFDCTDAPLTHFKPGEIGTSVARLRELGYETDAKGEPLTSPDQVCEMRVQDVVLPQSAAHYFAATARYVDDLLQRFYGLAPYYQLQGPDGLVGHLIAGLAPHTSGAVLGRVIGFTRANVGYAHPFMVAARRRNCVPGGTRIHVFNSPRPSGTSLGALFNAIPGPARAVDVAGTVAKRARGMSVLAVETATGRVRKQSIRQVLRVPAPRFLLRIRTASGREIRTAPDHRLVLDQGGALAKVKAIHAKTGDRLVFATDVDFGHADDAEIDLFAEFAVAAPPGLMVRGLRPTISAFCETRGLRRAADELGLTMKSLDNYRRRDSTPWRVARRLASRLGKDVRQLPRSLRLAVARDDVEIPRHIALDAPFLRLLGYYLAEGHSRQRQGNHYQVSIASTEPEVAQDVRAAWKHALCLDLPWNGIAITCSSRLVHDLFTRVLDLGSTARTKRIPPRIAALSPDRVAPLLSAYFAGDGNVEKNRLHVSCTSVSRGLLTDVGLQLARHGIPYRLSTSERPAGGAVREFLERKGRPLRSFVSHRLSVRSTDAVRFGQRIGFSIRRKQSALEASTRRARKSTLTMHSRGLAWDPIRLIEPVPCTDRWLYDLEVDEDHTFLTDELLATSNCDGDEDCYMLLLDAFLNFSRSFIPDRRGGLMDLPLVLATRIDPSEIDKEAHNLDVAWSYPLEFYRATEQHMPAKNIAAKMTLLGSRLGTPEQFERFGYTVESRSIHEGPVDSAYKTLGSMPEKMAAQLRLADKIRAVDAADVAARVISHHLLPDLMGNLKAFAKQSVRCTKCNTKYRRMPIAGKCTRVLANRKDMCGNALTLTVHQASVRKYMDLCNDLATKYAIPEYTKQHIRLIERFIDDTFRMRDVKLMQFA